MTAKEYRKSLLELYHAFEPLLEDYVGWAESSAEAGDCEHEEGLCAHEPIVLVARARKKMNEVKFLLFHRGEG